MEIGIVAVSQAAFIRWKGVRETVAVHGVHVSAHAGEEAVLAVAADVTGIAAALADGQHLAHRVQHDGVVVVLGLHVRGQGSSVGQLVVGVEAAGISILVYQTLEHRDLRRTLLHGGFATVGQCAVHLALEVQGQRVVSHHRRNARSGPVQHLDTLAGHAFVVCAAAH